MYSVRGLTIRALAGGFLALAWFKYLPVPFLGPALLVVVLSLVAVRRVRREAAQAALISLATIALTLGGAEAYLWIRDRINWPPNLGYPESYLRPDSVLGYAPAAGSKTRLRRTFRDSVLYDVVYTIDSLGLRVSPPEGAQAPVCALFFGDSYTIGEGVPDSAAMPYRAAVRAGGRYHVYNFGVHGYGPHQMLALLEAGRVKSRVDCTPRYAVYQAIPAHVLRVAGRVEVRGPRYRFRADGSLERDGVFLTTGLTPAWLDYLWSQLEKSALFGMLKARVREADRTLFVRLVKAAAEQVERDFPGAEFHVILWAAPGSRHGWIIDRLRAEGVRVHLIDDVMPIHRTDPKSMRIPHDGHPTAEAHDRIAAYVVSEILRDQGARR